LLVGAALLASCGPSKTQREASIARVKQQPGADDLRQATNPGYSTPTAQQQECLGRLIFDVPRRMEWGSQQPKAKAALQEIWMAASREEAHRAFDSFIVNHEASTRFPEHAY
jgi:hypothetical protein